MQSPAAKPLFVLLDLPVFPKGVLSLSLLAVEAAVRNYFHVQIHDLNLEDFNSTAIQNNISAAKVVGLKVSSQNFSIAAQISDSIKREHANIRIIWGGEFPTLLPSDALAHCHAIVLGPIEPVAEALCADLSNHHLKAVYDGRKDFGLSGTALPDFGKIKTGNYYSFMGLPFETSKGCDQKCRFCMVHVMQRHKIFKSFDRLCAELKNYAGHFVNVLDYNIGIEKEHLLSVARAFQNSAALGWMGEMCLESLDDDEVLKALRASRCRIIYCGLETISAKGLVSVNKSRTNYPAHYERIIRKAQRYGINIASGLIIGLEGLTSEDYLETMAFFKQMNLIYTKFTFLTYNPGTEVHRSMGKFGKYLATAIDEYDGNHFSYLPDGQEQGPVLHIAAQLISDFYSAESTRARAAIWKDNPVALKEFTIFSELYGRVYESWGAHGLLSEQGSSFGELLKTSFAKAPGVAELEGTMHHLRQQHCSQYQQ